MLNELMDIFLRGCIISLFPSDYADRDLFTSIIAVAVTVCMLLGSFAVLVEVIRVLFQS